MQFKGSKIWTFLLVFQHFSLKSRKIARILLPSNWNFSGLGWWILDFSKPVGQGGFGAHSEAKLFSQFMQTKFLCHKMSQNSTIFSVSYYRDCITINQLKNMASHISVPYVRRWYISTFIKWGLFYEKVFVVFVSVCKRYMYRKWNTWFFL